MFVLEKRVSKQILKLCILLAAWVHVCNVYMHIVFGQAWRMPDMCQMLMCANIAFWFKAFSDNSWSASPNQDHPGLRAGEHLESQLYLALEHFSPPAQTLGVTNPMVAAVTYDCR